MNANEMKEAIRSDKHAKSLVREALHGAALEVILDNKDRESSRVDKEWVGLIISLSALLAVLQSSQKVVEGQGTDAVTMFGCLTSDIASVMKVGHDEILADVLAIMSNQSKINNAVIGAVMGALKI